MPCRKQTARSGLSKTFLLQISRVDNLEHFIIDWEKFILRMKTLPDDAVLECFFKRQLGKSQQFKQTLA
eukprot:8637892-Karenia_brevis.AAC.1